MDSSDSVSDQHHTPTSTNEGPSSQNQERKPHSQQLPSILTSFDDLGPRRASLPTLSLNRPSSYSSSRGYTPQTASSLANYTFPPSSSDEYSSTSSSAFSANGLAGGSGGGLPSVPDDWIARPNSTPLRHGSFNSTLRISGHRSGKDWPYPSPSHHHHLSSSGASPSQHHSHHNHSNASYPPLDLPTALPPADQRPPQRKRGKLPKETTDFLKSWLHRHSDHPYPSEEEKKQLCHATGLSMSQVSNWMINARRRILAPARPTTGPTTTAPFPNNLGGTGISAAQNNGPAPGLVSSHHSLSNSPAHGQRRTSLPVPSLHHSQSYQDGLQLYHPMSLQSYGNGYSQPRNSLSGHNAYTSSGEYAHTQPQPQHQQQYLEGTGGYGANAGY